MNGKSTVTAFLLLTATIALPAHPAASTATPPTGSSGLVSDFDGDGFGDLAVASPGETVGDVRGAGAVNILYGSAQGLTSAGNQLLDEGTCLAGDPGYLEGLGEALAFGDFDGDGFDDLAIGVPNQQIGEHVEAGAVHIVYGSAAGLQCSRQQLWHQDSNGIGTAEADQQDHFGASLASGDLDGDGADDLAIGVPDETFSGVSRAGVVHVLYGSSTGLSADDDELWHQDVAEVEGTPEINDWYGWSLAIGDFGKTDHADLAVGVMGERVDGHGAAGAVHVLYGSAGGPTATGDQLWHQSVTGVGGTAETSDWFGWSLVAEDFGRDGRADLAVGTPFENVGGVAGAGAVNVLYGGPGGLAVAGNQLWHQGLVGILDNPEPFDLFGRSLAAGDLDGTGPADLAVGVSREYYGGLADTGAVHVLYSSGGTGLSDVGDQFFWIGSTDTADGGETFGTGLAAADFGRTTQSDLAIGAPGDETGGVVTVLYGSSAGATTTGRQRWSQSSPGIFGTSEAGDSFGSSLAAGHA
jgi:hypothetical protein